MNRGQLRPEIARALGCWVTGGIVAASPAPSSTEFSASELTGVSPSEVTGKSLAITSGTRIGQERDISAFDNENYKVTLRYALSGAPAAADTFEVYSRWGYSRINQSINNAITSARNRFLVPKFDRTLTVAAATYDYALPAGFAYVSTVLAETGAGVFDKVLANDDWCIVQISGVNYLRLTKSWPLTYVGYRLELKGQAYPGILSLDSESSSLPDQYIIAWVCFNLGSEMPLGQAEAGWRDKLSVWRQTLTDTLAQNLTNAYPGAQYVGEEGALLQGGWDDWWTVVSSVILALKDGTVLRLSSTGALQVGTAQVVGPQGAAIADASGGATIDTQARAAINSLLARLRTHGLIAT